MYEATDDELQLMVLIWEWIPSMLSGDETSCNVLSWTTGETAAGDVTGFSLGDACIPVSETVALDVSIPSQCGVFS